MTLFTDPFLVQLRNRFRAANTINRNNVADGSLGGLI